MSALGTRPNVHDRRQSEPNQRVGDALQKRSSIATILSTAGDGYSRCRPAAVQSSMFIQSMSVNVFTGVDRGHSGEHGFLEGLRVQVRPDIGIMLSRLSASADLPLPDMNAQPYNLSNCSILSLPVKCLVSRSAGLDSPRTFLRITSLSLTFSWIQRV